MGAEERREFILQQLKKEIGPQSSTSLAKQLGVSRQIIVGDIALLRAKGCAITATSRGYVMTPPASPGRYIGKVACQHTLAGAEMELRTIVEYGGEVLDVLVEHYLYGEITGQLNISTQEDVDDFVRRIHTNEARLLSELTGGVHLHTIACKDLAAFESITAALEKLSVLYSVK